ncbi:hypothetical protein AM571_CH01265 [Rhizobium etli 8C-3]|uniref:Uncharacterized protein n=1 Tax=Rhizobium etli 8C-3 TaxID=538025 RepID=A0A1L5P1W8_RHIET|nr:hypothetical protein AM571_CH01265 [Rhizobium etli 8C-3]
MTRAGKTLGARAPKPPSKFVTEGRTSCLAPFHILGSIEPQSTATEQATVNLTLTIFKIDTVIRTVEVCHFTFL